MCVIRSASLLLGLSTVSACSPYLYTKEITAFSTGVTNLASSYQTGVKGVDAVLLQQQEVAYATGRQRLSLLPGCYQNDPSGTPPKLADCAVVAFGVTTLPTPPPLQQNLTMAGKAFDALKTYAAALTAVTNAADDTTLNSATQNLTAAVSGLATEAGKLAPAAAPGAAAVSPALGLISQGITIYLDQQRYAALRETVPAADASVQALGKVVLAALLDIRQQQLAQLGTDLRADAQPLQLATVASLSLAAYQGKLTSLQIEVTAFNEARATDPTGTVTAMLTAHAQLAAALQNNTGQTKALATTVEAFAASAEKLQTAITAAAKPAPTATK